MHWFQKHAPSMAETYQGAVWLIQNKCIPGRIHFISHAVRDIADRLAFVLNPQLVGRRVQYENEMDVIAKNWPRMNSVEEKVKSTLQLEEVTINYKVVSRIDKLVKAHRERRERPSNYELLFDYLMRNQPSREKVNKRLVENFRETRKWFMEKTHVRRGKTPIVKETELQTQFANFERMLHSFVGNFFTGTQELDAILQQANR